MPGAQLNSIPTEASGIHLMMKRSVKKAQKRQPCSSAPSAEKDAADNKPQSTPTSVPRTESNPNAPGQASKPPKIAVANGLQSQLPSLEQMQVYWQYVKDRDTTRCYLGGTYTWQRT